MNGSAFYSYVVIPRKTLSVFGDEHVAWYKVGLGARKHYCSRCGTPLFNAGACMIYLGVLEPPPAGAPSLNVYCESMMSWVEHVGSVQKLQAGADGT